MSPRNIEFKAKLTGRQRAESLVEQLTRLPPLELTQDDTFFPVPQGRLKLRQFADDSGELIAYQRADQLGPRISKYWKVSTNEPRELAEVLGHALGFLGRVRKRRRVYLLDPILIAQQETGLPDLAALQPPVPIPTRVHFDEVVDLGEFLELEVVLAGAITESLAQQFANWFRKHLEIADEHLLSRPYLDLLGPTED